LVAAQRVHSNNILGLGVGQVRYGAFCDVEGLMVDDGTVYRLEDRVWVMTNGSEHADHFAAATVGLAVEIEAITLTMPHLGLQGPRSRDALGPLCDADLADLGYFRFYPEPTKVGGVPCVVSRTGFGGELGYELFCRPEHALDAVDFLGRDALKDVAARPPRRFKTLRIEGADVPEYGAEVTRDGEPVGTLTSPAMSPRFGLLGLAVLETGVAGEGESVEVALGSGVVPATVAPLAIYDPEKRRPRS
jgi:aminomethyltransferase